MLQSVSSVFVVYRRETLTGSPDPTHANGMDKPCITSPADVERHRRVILQDAEVPDENRKQFKELSQEYSDIFSQGAGDIGKTPLITMEIDTGDSPPV